jgi:radical SAM protein with 4Fe4S-binding SPASM domain
MEWELFSKITDELISEKKLPMFMLALHSEPLVDKRIFKWVKYLKSKNPKFYCIVPTNGELLDTFAPVEIAESGVDQLNINLSAYSKNTYERLHAGLDYERVIKNVNSFLVNETMKQKLQIMFVLCRENEREAQQTVKYWRQKGVRTKIINLNNRAGSLDSFDTLTLRHPHYTRPIPLRVWKYFMSNTRRLTGCELPFYQLNIGFNGDVIICSCDWKRATIIGNIKNNTLRSIWNSDRINDIRRLIIQKKYNQINSCKLCSQIMPISNNKD